MTPKIKLAFLLNLILLVFFTAVSSFSTERSVVTCENLFSQSTPFQLERADYEAFKEATIAVLDIAKDSPIIGIGRSPGPITTMLSILKTNKLANLPISSFRHRQFETPYSRSLPEYYTDSGSNRKPLSEAELQQLFAHFDSKIQDFLSQQEGTVYLIDLALSGASLFSMSQYLQTYAILREYKINFKTIALTNETYSQRIDVMAGFFGQETHKVILNDNKFIIDSLRSSPWDDFAEFESYIFDTLIKFPTGYTKSSFDGQLYKIPNGERGENYPSFKQAIQKYISQDLSFQN